MARIRTVKPDFWTDSKVVRLSPLARLLFIGSWNFADDYGALEPDAVQLKLRILPAEQCDPDTLIAELITAGLLTEMTNGDEVFWHIRGWEKHQKVDKRSKSPFGDPDSWKPAEGSPNPPDSPKVPPNPRSGRERNGREGKGEEGNLAPPSGDAPTTSKPRKQDELFEAMVEVCGLNPDELTKSARGRINTAVKELRDINASPEGVRARAEIHRQRWPNAELTPTSLSTNYAQLGTPQSNGRSRDGPQRITAGTYEALADEWERRAQ